MEETKPDSHHIVVIPVDEERQPIHNRHPLSEISHSPGHFLLLKLWQREEHLHGLRTSRKESRKDAIGRDIFRLCCSFFVFHGLFFAILFTSSSPGQCRRWWIPCLLSACASFVIVSIVHVKICLYWKADRQLHKERAEGRALARCVQELRMKGASFDLCKEPGGGGGNGKRLKSSSVEIKWAPLGWCKRYRVSVLLVCFAGLVLPSSRFVLCGL